MCYRPLHIKNGMCHYDAKTQPFYFDVPCGKCADCQRDKQTEWYVRSFYHWQDCVSKRGMGFFYTLTYNDENLPYYHGIPCFSYDDIKLFIKRLKERLRTKYKLNLTYLICSEYGHLRQRPHYHVDFFIDGQIMPWTFYNQVNEAWQKGFVYAGQNGGVISSSAGLLYVTKYVTKDSSFSERDKQLHDILYKEYSDFYDAWYLLNGDASCPSNFDELFKNHRKYTDRKELIDWYNEFQRRFHRMCTLKISSTYFGYSMLNRKDMIDSQSDTIMLPYGSKYVPVPLPRYALRYLYYDRIANDKDGKKNRFILSEIGKQHYLDTLDFRIDKRAAKMRDFFKNTRLTDYQFTKLDTHFKFNSNKEFSEFLRNLDVNFRHLAIYNLVYRNRFFIKDIDYFTDYKQYVSDLYSILENKNNPPIASLSSLEVNYINNHLFNFYPPFFVYEQLSMLYSQMVSFISEESAMFREQQRERERKLREYLDITKLKISA